MAAWLVSDLWLMSSQLLNPASSQLSSTVPFDASDVDRFTRKLTHHTGARAGEHPSSSSRQYVLDTYMGRTCTLIWTCMMFYRSNLQWMCWVRVQFRKHLVGLVVLSMIHGIIIHIQPVHEPLCQKDVPSLGSLSTRVSLYSVLLIREIETEARGSFLLSVRAAACTASRIHTANHVHARYKG